MWLGWRMRQVEAGWEEYYDYIFPADSSMEQPHLKLLAMAHRWKMQKESRAALAAVEAAATVVSGGAHHHHHAGSAAPVAAEAPVDPTDTVAEGGDQ